MATNRRPVQSSTANMNLRSNVESLRGETRGTGTRPTAKPSSIKEVLSMAVLHVCKKTIFFDTNLKVGLYLASLFLVSLIADFIPFPRSYFSRPDNLFNVYFVKIGWLWTLIFCCPFMYLTSFTLCCGNINKFIRNHLPRILIATVFWFVWTKLFNIIELSYGRCTAKNYLSKSICLKHGHLWNGFDISGHAFILIYSSLVLIEEAKPILHWDSIHQHLRNEEHNRNANDLSAGNPLRTLTDAELKSLKYLYIRYTPMIRTLFVGMTALQLLWDVMLVSTMLYYHRMIEKVLSGIIAILTWYFTYRSWYISKYLPDSPAKCSFIYQKEKKGTGSVQRTSSMNNQSSSSLRNQTPQFMGMPLYNNRPSTSGSNADQNEKK